MPHARGLRLAARAHSLAFINTANALFFGGASVAVVGVELAGGLPAPVAERGSEALVSGALEEEAMDVDAAPLLVGGARRATVA
mmetsp:Transcript_73998/g.164411  ORF Transcript_73998/g.164411 Transcript_73998/m.164411 type:complete len:84 (-) Transcript_73998:577-828(-)